MIIRIKTEEIIVSGQAEEIMLVIEQKVNEKQLLLNNLIIDGVEIYDNFIEYIEKHQQSINEIEVVALTRQEVIEYLKKEIQMERNQLIEDVEKLSDCFYGQNQEMEDWEKLVVIIERSYGLLQKVEDELDIEFADEKKKLFYFEKIKKIMEKLQIFNEAMKEKDCIYIADLLHFELAVDLKQFVFEDTI